MVLDHLLQDTSEFGLAFFKSFLTILCSEIGDKTFFIAAVLAMRNPRITVSTARHIEGAVVI